MSFNERPSIERKHVPSSVRIHGKHILSRGSSPLKKDVKWIVVLNLMMYQSPRVSHQSRVVVVVMDP